MSWRTHIKEARPSLDRLTPVEAKRICDILHPYMKAGMGPPWKHIKEQAPGLHALYETIELLGQASKGRIDMGGNAPDIAWSHLVGFWPEIDKACNSGDPQVQDFAGHLAEAVRETFPTKGFERS